MNDLPDTQKSQLTIFASTPQDMAEGQRKIVDWCAHKLQTLSQDLEEAQSNLDVAKRNKWRSKPFANRVRQLRNEITYYEKMKAASEEGYWIIPPFPFIEVFAVRVNRQRPTRLTSKWKYDSLAVPPDKNASEGEGRYVSDLPYEKHYAGAEGKFQFKVRTDFDEEVAFPSTVVKPEIIDATTRAMERKVFDDIGILPAQTRGDPIVVGRIHHPKQGRQHTVFFISWWMDYQDI